MPTLAVVRTLTGRTAVKGEVVRAHAAEAPAGTGRDTERECPCDGRVVERTAGRGGDGVARLLAVGEIAEAGAPAINIPRKAVPIRPDLSCFKSRFMMVPLVKGFQCHVFGGQSLTVASHNSCEYLDTSRRRYPRSAGFWCNPFPS